MPADESSAARGTGRSQATAAISRALAPPLLASARLAGPPVPAGLALRGRLAAGTGRRPAVPRSRGHDGSGPRTPAGVVCGGCTSRHAGPGTAR